MSTAVETSRPSYFSLCGAEPFRIFFPLALLIGISGVSLWPLFFTGMHKFYPGIMHSRMMIEGFLGGFVIGFLGTAMPRLLSAPPLRGWETWTLVVIHLTVAGLHIGHQLLLGDIAFVVLLLFFGGCLLCRVRHATDLPPPGFVLVGLGYLTGLSGTLLWIGGMKGWVSGSAMMLGGLWLNQAFVLLLILGVGTFLLPRFLAIQGIRPLDEERTASRAWILRALAAGCVGIAMLVSYWLEAGYAMVTPAALVRGGAVVIYLLCMVPIFRTSNPGRTVPLAVNIALVSVVLGLAFPLFWPGQRIAGLHVVFLAGFSLITFTVATRVVLGHSGNGHLFRTRLPILLGVIGLLLIATVLRVIGDFLPEQRTTDLNLASYLWMSAAAAWGMAILPKVRIPDVGDENHPPMSAAIKGAERRP
jgi:uncharacterized protein involved in response to NO